MLIDKVEYEINWKNFTRGRSIFIPCLNCDTAKEKVMEVMNRLQINVLAKRVVVDGVQGLRIWRL